MTSKATLFYRAGLLLIETPSMTVTVRHVTRDNVYGALTNAGFRITSGWERSATKQCAQVRRRPLPPLIEPTAALPAAPTKCERPAECKH